MQSSTAAETVGAADTLPERMLDSLTLAVAVLGWMILCLVAVFATGLRESSGMLPAIAIAGAAGAWWVSLRAAGAGRRWSAVPFYGMCCAALAVSLALAAVTVQLLGG